MEEGELEKNLGIVCRFGNLIHGKQMSPWVERISDDQSRRDDWILYIGPQCSTLGGNTALKVDSS